MDLGFTATDREGRAVLSVQGEIDVATAPQLRERLLELVGTGERDVILDLDGVGFLDSTGLGVIVGCLKRARTNGRDLVLVCTNRPILKVLEITGLTRVFAIHDTVDAAASSSSG
jgi:anti-sigma B factor antagonist